MQCILNRSLSFYLELNKCYGLELERDLVVISFLTVMKLVQLDLNAPSLVREGRFLSFFVMCHKRKKNNKNNNFST